MAGRAIVPDTQATHTYRWFDGLWLLCLCAYIMAGVPLVPFHGDESTQIYMGRDTHFLLAGRADQLTYVDNVNAQSRIATHTAITNPTPSNTIALLATYDQRATDQHLRLLNGTIPKYLFGLVSAALGQNAYTVNDQYVWGAGWDYNWRNGHIPPDDVLYGTRWVSAAFLAFGAIMVFIIGQFVGGRWVAYLASAYYALNPALLINGRRTMMEGALIGVGLLVIVVALWLLWRYRQHKRIHWQLVALGIASGLAVASKHTAVVTVAAAFLVCGSYLLIAQPHPWRRRINSIGGLIAAGLLSLLVFYALNPAWWGAPVDRAFTVLEMRTDLLSGQTEAFGGYADITDQTTAFLRQVFIVTPMYSEVDFFLPNIANAIATYENSPLKGISIGGSLLGALILAACFAGGLYALIMDKRIAASTRWLIIVWGGLTLVFVWIATPLEWQRYYLPAYPVVGLVAALGLTQLIRQISTQYKRRSHA